MTTLFALSLMAPTNRPGGGVAMLVIQFGALIAIFYFLLIRPQSQARKKHAALLANLKKNDEVITGGGIVGKVRELKETRVTIESGTSTLVIDRNRIVQVGNEAAPGGTP